MAAIALAGAGRAEIFGQPRGLYHLIFAEAWERFAFYGMQALLVLYLGQQLLLPGHVEHVAGFAAFKAAVFAVTGPLSNAALASIIFGIYGSLVYITPLIGGFLADRWLGRTACVAGGALLMAAGHFLMAFEASFLVALACIVVGVGGFKGNISTQVGELYALGDARRDTAFQLFFLGINFGVIFAPLVCGTLGQTVAWHWGFGAAGLGMLAGLAAYLTGRRWLPAERGRMKGPEAKGPALTGEEWGRTALLAALVPVLATAAVGNFQAFNGYLVWANGAYDLHLFGRAVPVTWLVSFGGVGGMIMITLSVAFWRWWAARWPAPSEIGKCAIGGLIMAGAPLVLAVASLQTGHGHRVSLLWALAFEMINDFGYANLVPISYALFTRAAPPRIAGTMIAVCLLQFFVANLLVGALGTLLESLGGAAFWALHAALAAGASLVLALVWRVFGRMLSPTV